MEKEKQERYARGRRLIKEFEMVLSDYQKLMFYIQTQREELGDIHESLIDQAVIMEEYLGILLERIKFINY